MKNNYYVYALCDPTKNKSLIIESNTYDFVFMNEPFYVGYGRGDRMNSHWKNLHFNNLPITRKWSKLKKLKKDGLKPIEIKLIDNISKEEAIAYEIFLIEKIGRIDFNSGPLTNGTDGGDGAPQLNEESRKKMGAHLKGKKYTEEEWVQRFGNREDFNFFKMIKMPRVLKMIKKRGWREGINREKEIRKKIANKLNGAKRTAEQKERLSLALKGIPKPNRTELHRKKLSQALKGKLSGQKNPMFGIDFRDLWEEKYGRNKRDELENNRKKKISIKANINKAEAQKIFPNLKGNGAMIALRELQSGKDRVIAEDIGRIHNENEKRISIENRLKQAKEYFWNLVRNGNKEKIKIVNESKLLIKIRNENGKRDSQTEINEINVILQKKRTLYRKNRISFLDDCIARYKII